MWKRGEVRSDDVLYATVMMISPRSPVLAEIDGYGEYAKYCWDEPCWSIDTRRVRWLLAFDSDTNPYWFYGL